MKPKRFKSLLYTASASGAILGCFTPGAKAQDASKFDKLEQENADLKRRLETLEGIAQKEGILPSGQPAPHVLSALSSINVSGFVQASYFFNSREPADRKSDGYLWNTTHNSFSINKVKLTIASPAAERSGEKWDAAFRVSMIWGEDAPVLDTGNYSTTVNDVNGNPVTVRRQSSVGFDGLREAYVELNAPLGSGLNIKAGQLISLLNYESGDGGAANPNFSQGYQWFFTGNGPSAGVQLGYTFTDWLDLKVRVQNGLYAGAIDNNNGKTFVASIGVKPMKDLWFNLIGFDGKESPTLMVKGGSILAGYDITSQFHTGLEFDYFRFTPTAVAGQDLWSIGGWAWYDFTPKVGLAVRAEYLDDPDGGGLKGIGLPGRDNSAIQSTDDHGNIASVALTLNWRPVPRIKIQPEVRYDHTSYSGGFDGKNDRVVFGAGVSYLF